MGLDMYLTGKYFIWDRNKDSVKIEGVDLHGYKLSQIEIEAGYWRKANAIHRWFVENVQNGIDECQESWVSRDKLEELLKVCKAVLYGIYLVDGKIISGYQFKDGKKVAMLDDGKVVEDSKIAEELLPTQGGLFFGDTSYDEYYFEDIKHTIEVIEKALKLPSNWDFYYTASW
jgi:hypothetical protein